MRFFFLLLIFSLTACQDYNSNSGDRGRYGPIVLNESDPNFAKAYGIIQNRCVSCHDHVHDRWADLKSNDDWVTEGVVTPLSAANSELIQRIVNTGGADSNMPPGGSPLSNEEYSHLLKWVNEFQ